MQAQLYDAMYEQEKVNWWFVGRRQLVRDAFLRARHNPNSSQLILDLGCGTGAMLETLNPCGHAVGIDQSPLALARCQSRGLSRLLCGDGARLPFREGCFDCVTAMDVLEHIEDDRAVLKECHRVCAANGLLVLTVPALRWLWTTRDVRLEHKRRYHRAALLELAQEAGFTVEKCSYYTVCLFPLLGGLVLFRRLFSSTPHVAQDVPAPPTWINKFLLMVLRAEQWIMRWINFPIGVSLFCVLRKR